MRMLKHGRLTSGGATFLDYFFSPVLLRPAHETGQRHWPLIDPIPLCLVVPNRRTVMRNCRATDRSSVHVVLDLCHIFVLPRPSSRLVPVRGRPFGRILWFANGRGASRASRWFETPRVRFSRPTSVTSPPRRGENRKKARAVIPRRTERARRERAVDGPTPLSSPSEPLVAAVSGRLRAEPRQRLGRRSVSVAWTLPRRARAHRSEPAPRPGATRAGSDPSYRAICPQYSPRCVFSPVRRPARRFRARPLARRGWHIPKMRNKIIRAVTRGAPPRLPRDAPA